MSMFIEIYEVLSKEELTKYLEWYKGGALYVKDSSIESKSVRRIANEWDLRFQYNGMTYYRMVPICCGSYRQGWFMKHRWYKHLIPEVWFIDLNSFMRYCLKYMNLKDSKTAMVYYETVQNFKEEPAKQKVIVIAW